MSGRKKYNVTLNSNKIWFLSELKKYSIKNSHSKEEFNSTMSTHKNIENFMYRVQTFESKSLSKKELFDLNKEEFLDFISLLGCPSQECLSTYLSMVRQYKEFAVIHNLSSTNIDNLKGITFRHLPDYLDDLKVKGRFFTQKEVLTVVEQIATFQDKALFMLIYEGVNGIKNKDLINLKKNDIDFKSKKIILGDRIIRMSDELSVILEKASREKVYANMYSNSIQQRKFYNDLLVDSEYILRPTEGYVAQSRKITDPEYINYSGEHVLPKTITARFYRFTKEMPSLENVTITTLFNSGIVNRAIAELGEFCSKRDFVEYCVEVERVSQGTGYKLFSVWVETLYSKIHYPNYHPEKKHYTDKERMEIEQRRQEELERQKSLA